MAAEQKYLFNPYLIFILLIGLVLSAYCCYTLGVSIYHLLFWDRTSGVILDFKSDDESENDVYYVKLKYRTPDQKEFEVITDKSVGIEGLTVGEEVTVFYSPGNPSRFQPSFLMVSYFLVSLLLPFGLLLVYLAWPFGPGGSGVLRSRTK